MKRSLKLLLVALLALAGLFLSLRKAQETAMTHFLRRLSDGLKKAGFAPGLPAAGRLKKAVATKDRGEIGRAFHDAIYDRSAQLTESLPIVKSYLGDPDPFVRYTAARTLYTAGDRSGYPVLLGMVTSSAAIPDGKFDLRIEAAQVLADFHETEATGSIVQLYQKTTGPGLLAALAKLGGPEIDGELLRQGFYPNTFSIVRYGVLRAPDFSPQLISLFNGTDDPEMKVAAAWALARLGHSEYTDYLIQTAQPAIDADPKGVESFDAHSDALKYLGSLPDPNARPVLIAALGSKNPVAVQDAVVNLLFNQPSGSDEAVQVVLRELRGEQYQLGTELMLNIATQLDDPRIPAAVQAFQARAEPQEWQYASARKHWPIYNWIDSYVVALKH